MTKEKKAKQVKQIASDLFMPVLGGIAKQPFISVLNRQVVTGNNNTLSVIKSVYRDRGFSGFYRGYCMHFAKIAPSNMAAGNAMRCINDDGSIGSMCKRAAAAAVAESIVSSVPESLELEIANSREPISYSVKSAISQGSKALCMIPASIVKNSGYWAGIIATARQSRNIENPTSRLAFEAVSATAVAVATTPFHLAAGQAYKHGTANPLPHVSKLVLEKGAKVLLSGAGARAGIIGISAFLNTQSVKFVDMLISPDSGHSK